MNDSYDPDRVFFTIVLINYYTSGNSYGKILNISRQLVPQDMYYRALNLNYDLLYNWVEELDDSCTAPKVY